MKWRERDEREREKGREGEGVREKGREGVREREKEGRLVCYSFIYDCKFILKHVHTGYAVA